MRIGWCILLFFSSIFVFQFVADARAVGPFDSTTQPAAEPTRKSVEVSADSVRYSIADSERPQESPVKARNETIDDDQSADESAVEDDEFPSEDRAAFLKLSRQAFMQLDHGDQLVKPAVRSDESRRLQWLDEHQRRKDGRNASDSLPEHKDVLTLTNGDNLAHNQTCNGDLFKHKIRMAGCEPKIIINRFCHGSCSSFYIPKLRSKKLKATFRSCAACVPVETDYVKVQLNCPSRGQVQRTVVRVKRCACRNIQFDAEEVEE